jgi:hypothetical protein
VARKQLPARPSLRDVAVLRRLQAAMASRGGAEESKGRELEMPMALLIVSVDIDPKRRAHQTFDYACVYLRGSAQGGRYVRATATARLDPELDQTPTHRPAPSQRDEPAGARAEHLPRLDAGVPCLCGGPPALPPRRLQAPSRAPRGWRPRGRPTVSLP